MQYRLVYGVILFLIMLVIILIVIRILLLARHQKSSRLDQYGYGTSLGSRDVQTDCGYVGEYADGMIGILVDGRGRYRSGIQASTITLETIRDVCDMGDHFHNPQYLFQKSFHLANHRVLEQLEDGFAEVSVAMALIKHRTLYYALVGNVRIYVFRSGQLIPITEGHTVDVLAKKRYQQGNLTKQTTISLLREHRLYNYIGQDGFHEIELFDQPIQLMVLDIVVFLSDGIYDTIPHDTLEHILQQRKSCKQKISELLQSFERVSGEKDNASAILITVL